MGSPREVVLAWVEALNRQDAAAVAALCHEDVLNLQVAVGKPSVGRQAMLEHFPNLFRAFPDSHTQSGNLFENGEGAILEWELSGTWRGESAGHQPNGRPFKGQGSEIFQVVGGRIKLQRGYWDKATWFSQLGIPLG